MSLITYNLLAIFNLQLFLLCSVWEWGKVSKKSQCKTNSIFNSLVKSLLPSSKWPNYFTIISPPQNKAFKRNILCKENSLENLSVYLLSQSFWVILPVDFRPRSISEVDKEFIKNFTFRSFFVTTFWFNDELIRTRWSWCMKRMKILENSLKSGNLMFS